MVPTLVTITIYKQDAAYQYPTKRLFRHEVPLALNFAIILIRTSQADRRVKPCLSDS